MNHYTKKRIDNEKLSRQIAMHRFERVQRRDILSMIWAGLVVLVIIYSLIELNTCN